MLTDAARTSPVPAEFAQSIPRALGELNVPAYVVDARGRVRWVNAAAEAITGDVVGRPFVEVVDLDPVTARAIFARRLAGVDDRDHSVVLVAPDGTRQPVEISAARLRRGHHVIGMFGVAIPREPRPAQPDASPLTPRQHEVLAMLADGASTHAIASRLFLSEQTVRNHIRHILQRLDCHSRLAAVATARDRGLV